MDINNSSPTYPRVLGVLLGLLLPGSAHFLSGDRKAGIRWFAGLLLFSMLAFSLLALPARWAVWTGLALMAPGASLLLILMLVRSARPIPKMSGGKWALFIVVLIGIRLLLALGRAHAPLAPFRLPTGGMEPTLHGAAAAEGAPQTAAFDRFLHGAFHREFRAAASGPASGIQFEHNKIKMRIGEEEHELPVIVSRSFHPKRNYQEGELIWEGTLSVGDHLIANRWAYLFSGPRRSDIVLFSTEGLDCDGLVKNTVFIKRVVGLPGETAAIRPPNLIINGAIVEEPAVFRDLHYQHAGQLAAPEDSITLGPDEYLVLGDNTGPNLSLDGRCFGPVKRENIRGKVLSIYWPLSRAGPVR